MRGRERAVQREPRQHAEHLPGMKIVNDDEIEPAVGDSRFGRKAQTRSVSRGVQDSREQRFANKGGFFGAGKFGTQENRLKMPIRVQGCSGIPKARPPVTVVVGGVTCSFSIEAQASTTQVHPSASVRGMDFRQVDKLSMSGLQKSASREDRIYGNAERVGKIVSSASRENAEHRFAQFARCGSGVHGSVKCAVAAEHEQKPPAPAQNFRDAALHFRLAVRENDFERHSPRGEELPNAAQNSRWTTAASQGIYKERGGIPWREITGESHCFQQGRRWGVDGGSGGEKLRLVMSGGCFMSSGINFRRVVWHKDSGQGKDIARTTRKQVEACSEAGAGGGNRNSEPD